MLDIVLLGLSHKTAPVELRECIALDRDETLLVQSGKPVGIVRSHTHAPRVLIANANIVPNWANWDYFNELEKKGLIFSGRHPVHPIMQILELPRDVHPYFVAGQCIVVDQPIRQSGPIASARSTTFMLGIFGTNTSPPCMVSMH